MIGAAVALAVALTAAPPSAAAPASLPALAKPHGVGSPARAGASEPRLAATADGALLMTWLEPAGGVTALRVASLRESKWSAAATVVQSDSLVQSWPNLAGACAFGAHGVAVAWPERAGATERLRIALSKDGGATWGKAAILHDDREGSTHGFVSLLPQGEGVRAIWLDGHNLKDGLEEGAAPMTLHSRFIAPTGTLALEQELDGRVCDCCWIGVAPLGDELLVAYRDRSDDEIRDIAVTRLESGRWQPPYGPRYDGWKLKGCPVNGPAIATRGDRVAVAWYTAAADSPRVLTAFSNDRGWTFGDAIRVDDGHPLGRVGLALLDDGGAAVTWLEGDRSRSTLRVRRLKPGARSSTSTEIARFDGPHTPGVPQLARDRDRLLFAWTQAGKAQAIQVASLPVPRP
ncbi:MAG TPA: hypothetical protein VMJ70_12025 [Candidatus Sulfotelmatobacter sp.]|nr:hypothetical protein [Candidatus Sulfotelmatobacter sp.]